MQVPVVGWTPLKSMEQLGAFGVFGLCQIFFIADLAKVRSLPPPSEIPVQQRFGAG